MFYNDLTARGHATCAETADCGQAPAPDIQMQILVIIASFVNTGG